MPEVPEAIRAHWRQEAAKAEAGALHAVLARSDPQMAGRLAPGDTQRIVRALEVLDASGVSLLDWQQRPRAPVLDAAETIRIVVAPERDELYRRIDARFEGMLAAGALEEVRQLAGRGLDPRAAAHGRAGAAPAACASCRHAGAGRRGRGGADGDAPIRQAAAHVGPWQYDVVEMDFRERYAK